MIQNNGLWYNIHFNIDNEIEKKHLSFDKDGKEKEVFDEHNIQYW